MKKKLYLVDLWVLKKTKAPTDKYCEITGRSNFHLAKLLLSFSTILILVSTVIYENSTPFLIGLNTFVWGLNHFFMYRSFTRAESKAKATNESGTLDVDLVRMIISFASDRRWFGGWTIIFFVLSPIMSDGVELFLVGLILRSLSGYAASWINFGGKSLYQKVKDKIRDTAKKYKPSIPDLSPSPIPA